nr:hypothetical protein DA06_26715 [Georgenia sp. SUBG003]
MQDESSQILRLLHGDCTKISGCAPALPMFLMCSAQSLNTGGSVCSLTICLIASLSVFLSRAASDPLSWTTCARALRSIAAAALGT